MTYYYDVSSQVTEIDVDLLRLGIRHEDIRRENLFWSEELERVVLPTANALESAPRSKEVV